MLNILKTILTLLIIAQVYFVTISKVSAACTWPSAFISSQWLDSARGTLTFGTTSMQGWTFYPAIGVNMSSWDCLSVSTFSTDGRIIMITSNAFQLFQTTLYAYVCLTVTKVTSASFRYYINNDLISDINERVSVRTIRTLTDLGTLCSNNGASGGEYQILIKEGNASSAKIDCPWFLLGNYGYSYTSAQNVTTCDKATSEMSVCNNSKQITFNYTSCPTKVAYSVSNTVWCVGNVPSDGIHYIMLYNANDAVTDINNTSIFRFTCMAVSSDATSASVSPKYCQSGQKATSIPLTPDGKPTGALLSIAAPSVTCQTCAALQAPVNGNVTVNTIDSVTSAFYTCAENLTLWGESHRTCQTDGTWTGTVPICSCDNTTVPAFGTLTINLNGSLATYTCIVGYTLNGLLSRNCLSATGKWTGNDTTCVECPVLPTPSNGSVTLETNGSVTTTAFACNVGYTLSGNTTLTCNQDGSWTSSEPTCVECSKLSRWSNGSVTLLSNGSVTTALYTCSLGYTLNGTATQTCKQDGKWSSYEPNCVKCSVLSGPSNGSVTLLTNGSVTMAVYTCMLEYTLVGDAIRTCKQDGNWTSNEPTCAIQERMICPVFNVPVNVSVTLWNNRRVTTATYTCTKGYTLRGKATRTCSHGGEWTFPQPICVKCPVLSSPSSGMFGLFTNGSVTTATFACNVGYMLSGNATLTCNPDGTWTNPEPICVLTETSKGTSTHTVGLIVGIVAGVLLVLAIVAALIFIRKRRSGQTHETSIQQDTKIKGPGSDHLHVELSSFGCEESKGFERL